MAFIISVMLMLGPAPSVEAYAPMVHSSQASVDQVKEDRKDPRTRGKGKKKGVYKRDSTPANKFADLSSASTFALASSDLPSVSVKDKKGKCKSKKNCKPSKKSAKKKRPGGKGTVRNRAGNGSRPSSGTTSNPPTVVRPNLIVKCGGKNYNAGQGRVVCVTIEQPTETRVEYSTKTVTDKVLYGLGVITAAAVLVGLFTLFLGFILGWRKAGKAEEKFLDSVLNDTKED